MMSSERIATITVFNSSPCGDTVVQFFPSSVSVRWNTPLLTTLTMMLSTTAARKRSQIVAGVVSGLRSDATAARNSSYV